MPTYTAITIPGTGKTQQAYSLPDGTKVIVDLRASTISPNIFNREPNAHLAIQVNAWTVNDDGSAKLDGSGNKKGPVSRTETILQSAITDKTVDLTSTLSDITLAALDRITNWLAVQTQVAALIAASQETPTPTATVAPAVTTPPTTTSSNASTSTPAAANSNANSSAKS